MLLPEEPLTEFTLSKTVAKLATLCVYLASLTSGTEQRDGGSSKAGAGDSVGGPGPTISVHATGPEIYKRTRVFIVKEKETPSCSLAVISTTRVQKILPYSISRGFRELKS